MTHFYAIQWTYGRACDDGGRRIGEYRRFSSRSDRDAWVDEGAEYVTSPGAREAILSSDSGIRAINRKIARGEGRWADDGSLIN